MDNQTFTELASAYVLGALSPEERKSFEKELSSITTEQKDELRQLLLVSESLNLAGEEQSAGSHVKEEIFRVIAAKEMTKSKAGNESSIFEKIAAFFGLDKPALSLVVSFVLLFSTIGISFYASSLYDELELTQRQLALVENEFESQQRVISVLYSPQLTFVDLGGTDADPEGYGKVMWCQKDKFGVIQLANLSNIPDDKDYQLWVIKEGVEAPISAGVFNIENRPGGTIYIDELVETDRSLINAFAVSIEPKGGMPQPTGDIVLLGAI